MTMMMSGLYFDPFSRYWFLLLLLHGQTTCYEIQILIMTASTPVQKL